MKKVQKLNGNATNVQKFIRGYLVRKNPYLNSLAKFHKMTSKIAAQQQS